MWSPQIATKNRVKERRARMLQTCAAVLFLALSFSGCAVARYLAEPVTPDDFAQKISALAGPAGVVGSQVYLLEFDFDGRLNNPFEVAKAIAYIRERRERNDPVKKIVILSFGWNHERSEAVEFYIKYLSEYIATVPDAREKLKQDVIFCISWDSNAGGF